MMVHTTYWLVVFALLATGSEAGNNLVITNADRTIDISSQLVKVNHKLTLSNNGQSDASDFIFAVSAGSHGKLSHVSAQLADGNKVLKSMYSGNENGAALYTISLKDALRAGRSVKVLVELVFAHHLTPHPAVISQREKQLVQYKGSAYILSPYNVVSQSTKVLLSSANVESFTKVKPSSQSDMAITYGPYENVSPWTEQEVVIHYENNNPFLSVSTLLRHVEVSHWGNIAVEETIDVYHSGAKLKGSFSRFEYQREQSGVSSVKAFKTLLPASASDVYYRDEIGNISTSNLREGDDSMELELRPRFPLFGGWRTHYVVGYNMPSYEFLYNSGNDYVLQMRLIDHIFDDMVVDDALVRIILPEGASNIEIETPYSVQRLPDTLHYTYLDTKGRPVIELRASNLVENHIQDFKLHYTFARVLMFQEPILCVLAFFLLFLTVIVYVRLDFSITKDEASENKLRAAGLAEAVRARQLKRSILHQQYEDQINKLKASKDMTAFQNAVKVIQTDLKAESISDMKVDNAALSEKISEIHKADKALREVQANHGLLVEKLISGKKSKQLFLESEAPLTKKKEELNEKINQLLSSM